MTKQRYRVIDKGVENPLALTEANLDEISVDGGASAYYGEMSIQNGSTFDGITGTWGVLKHWTHEGISRGMVLDSANGTITITNVGKYELSFAISTAVAIDKALYVFSVRVDGVNQDNLTMEFQYDGASNLPQNAFSGLLDITTPDSVVTIGAWSDVPTSNGITTTWMNLNIRSIGAQGAQGIPGPVGSDLNYVHNQVASVTVWTIVHNLGKYPNVSQWDSAGEPIQGNVEHTSINELTITHYFATDGTATLN